jgi:hypothetical protein
MGAESAPADSLGLGCCCAMSYQCTGLLYCDLVNSRYTCVAPPDGWDGLTSDTTTTTVPGVPAGHNRGAWSLGGGNYTTIGRTIPHVCSTTCLDFVLTRCMTHAP